VTQEPQHKPTVDIIVGVPASPQPTDRSRTNDQRRCTSLSQNTAHPAHNRYRRPASSGLPYILYITATGVLPLAEYRTSCT